VYFICATSMDVAFMKLLTTYFYYATTFAVAYYISLFLSSQQYSIGCMPLCQWGTQQLMNQENICDWLRC
jgi:hypothetical protein